MDRNDALYCNSHELTVAESVAESPVNDRKETQLSDTQQKRAIVASFLVIFAFCSTDSAISPMVREIGHHFGVPMNEVLHLISACTTGIIGGVLIGPTLTASCNVARLLTLCTIGLVVSLAGFLLSGKLFLALVFRFVFGVSSGVFASCMWWMTYYGVSKDYYPAMVTVLMSARPLATAIGVPLAGIIATKSSWQAPFVLFGLCIFVFGALLALEVGRMDRESKKGLTLTRLFSDYVNAFRVPNAATFYVGLTINRMCYFGFYSVSGIWFIEHYELTLLTISSALFFIGLGEALVHFAVPKLIRLVGDKRLFLGSLVISGILFPAFISGRLELKITVALITVFMILDRIYSTTLIIALPRIFPTAENKTVFGSLNTLTAWVGLTAITSIAAEMIKIGELAPVQHLLTICFLVGSTLLYLVQRRALPLSSAS